MMVALLAFSMFLSAQQSTVKSLKINSMNDAQVVFNSCFQVVEQTTDMKMKNVNRSEFSLNSCTRGLNGYTSPLTYQENTSFRQQRMIYTKAGWKPTGIRQNVNVVFKGVSADAVILAVTINDQAEQFVALRPNETAFVPASLLDPNDKQTAAYFVVSANLYK